jgi:hypothetical protein
MFEDFFTLSNAQFWAIIERFIVNIIFLFLLIQVVYYRFSKKEMYVFSLFLMGIVIFILGSMLPIVFSTSLFGGELGIAVGLFAIFTILRFRTRNLDVKDMAYFFTVIAISAVNSFKWANFPLLGIFIFNLIIILSAFILELLMVAKTKQNSKPKKESYNSHPIIYDNLEMLKPQNKEKLKNNIIEITGLDVKKIRVREVNYKEKFARLEIFY